MTRFSSKAVLFAIACAFLCVAGTSVAQPVTPSIPDNATPPLWVVEKDGKKLYLFGAIHLMPPQTHWQRDEITQAIAASQVFVFEAPLDHSGTEMSRFVEKDGKLKDGHTLKEAVAPQVYADLETAAWKVQCSPMMFRSFRPWLAAVYLELCGYIKAGFSRYDGVDQVIEEGAVSRGAALDYFETVEEQLSYFAALDRKTEAAYLRATVHGVLEDPDLPYKLLSAWSSANMDELTKFVDDGFKDVPELKSQLLVARNKKWVVRIKEMLVSDRTYFVTVGVGHLVGKDSVVAMLRANGFKITGP